MKPEAGFQAWRKPNRIVNILDCIHAEKQNFNSWPTIFRVKRFKQANVDTVNCSRKPNIEDGGSQTGSNDIYAVVSTAAILHFRFPVSFFCVIVIISQTPKMVSYIRWNFVSSKPANRDIGTSGLEAAIIEFWLPVSFNGAGTCFLEILDPKKVEYPLKFYSYHIQWTRPTKKIRRCRDRCPRKNKGRFAKG